VNDEQRKSLIQIVSGRAKEDGPFALFEGTFSRFLEPQFVDINSEIEGKKSSFSVPGIVNVEKNRTQKSSYQKDWSGNLSRQQKQRLCISHLQT
jgi:hypothetical protein